MVSIHAPTRGATGASTTPSITPSSFNSRSHAGSDHVHTGGKSLGRVSIHAPTRGATPPTTSTAQPRSRFNSRSHAGSDTKVLFLILQNNVSIHAPTRGATLYDLRTGFYWLFQFTLPRGERHVHRTITDKRSAFQFTLPRGERHRSADHRALPRGVSIHAPTRGATRGRGLSRGRR